MRKDIIQCCCVGQRTPNDVSGYHNKTYAFYQQYLQDLEGIIKTRVQNGIRRFACGATSEAELDFAETVLNLRKKYPDVELEISLPFPSPPTNFSPIDLMRYKRIIRYADTLLFLFNQRKFTSNDEFERYMIDNSLYTLVVWNGLQKGNAYNAITYALAQGKLLDILTLPTIQIKKDD